MPIQTLATKLYIPPPGPAFVPRQRLNKLLDDSLGCKLTLVSAPPGYGKTTLLSAWIASWQTKTAPKNQPHFCWLSLDMGDNDPARFLVYLIAAIQTSAPSAGQSVLSSLQRQQPPDIENAVSELLIDLTATREKIILVLDDFFMIHEPAVHHLLTGFIERMPSQISVIVATRVDPILPLARLRVSNQLIEVRAEDLQFTVSEASELLKSAMGLNLLETDIASLVIRTEGWAAGLQMAGLSLQQQTDATAFIEDFTGSNRYIFEYLVEEVLAHQPGYIQEFLLKTSILDHLCAPLCEAILSGASASNTETHESTAEILSYLEHANLFLVSLDSERRWYRYHHLFADLLRVKLQDQWADQISALHFSASQWYEGQGVITEAIQHALEAGDLARVARLVASNVLALIEHGELSVLLRQLEELPEEESRCTPWLCVARAWALAYTGQLIPVESLLRAVEDGLVDQEPTPLTQALNGHIAAIRAYVEWIQGNFDCAIELAQQANGLLMEDEPVARALNLTTLGNAQMYCGDLQQTARVLAQAVRLSREATETHVTLLAGASLAYVQLMLGELHQAHQICQDLLELAMQYARRSGSLMPAASGVLALQSAIHLEWNKIPSALTQARQGLTLAQEWGQADSLTVAYMYLGRVLLAMGDIPGAQEAIAKSRQVAGQVSLWFLDLADTAEAELNLTLGKLEQVEEWSHVRRLKPDDKFTYAQESDYRILAWLLIEQGQADDALTLLNQLPPLLEPTGAVRSMIKTYILQALAWQALGQQEPALVALEKAIALGERGGFLRIFIEKGAPVQILLSKLSTSAAHQIQWRRSSYLQQVMAAFASPDVTQIQASSSGQPATSLPASWDIPVEPISEREMEVLRYLAGYLSVPEIAEALYLSPHTVRSHVKSVYSKLCVHNRSQAVQRARELGLI